MLLTSNSLFWSIAMTVVYEKQIRRSKRRRAFFGSILTTAQSISVGCSMTYYYWHSEASCTTLWFVVRCILFLVAYLSYALWALARYQLGSSLAFTVSTDGPLITTGLYSKFSSPIYLFGTIALISYLFLINRPIWLCVLIILLPMQLFRSKKESRALMKKYDEQYEAYLQRVWI